MTTSNPDRKGLMAALCTTAMWGMAGIFVRWLPGWSPFAILAGRFLVATAAMLPILVLASSDRLILLVLSVLCRSGG
jgi:EamA domain-containing membrane protein RarD